MTNTNSPLHIAVQNGNIEIVKTLLEAGHNPHEINADGLTPFRIAIQMGNAEIAALLAEYSNKQINTITAIAEPYITSNRFINNIIESFRNFDFKNELLPITMQNAVVLMKNSAFWTLFILGCLPIAIATIQNMEWQLYGLFFFFALVWGGVLRGLILRSTGSIVLPVTAFFFTGIIGLFLLSLLHYCLPNFFNTMPIHENLIIRLFGSIFHTGFTEELCKILPVILYCVWKRTDAEPIMMLTIGVFSGLGFAAFENIGYAGGGVASGLENIGIMVDNMINAQNEEEFQQAVEAGGVNTILHTMSVMIMTLLRAVSLTFAHAIWTGIFAYYLARAFTMHKPWTVYVCLGFGVSIVLHGTYNWLWTIQPGYTAFIVGISFVLFYIYLTNIRQCAESPEKQETSHCDEQNTQQLTILEN